MSSMLRYVCPWLNVEPVGLAIPTPRLVIDEFLPVGSGPISSMLRTGDCGYPGLDALWETVLCCDIGFLPSRIAMTSFISSLRADSSDMLAVLFWLAIIVVAEGKRKGDG